MKRRYVKLATNLWLFLIIFAQPWIATTWAEAAASYRLPWFRIVESVAGKPPDIAADTPAVLLADADFPPFSFASQTGSAAGLAVELAMAACAEAKLRCSVKLLPFGDLLPALIRGEADAIISGPRIEESVLNSALMTRPWFRTMARFAVQSGNPVKAGDAGSLRGKRIGAVKGTVHARWLETYYRESEIVAFADEITAGEALRTGNIEALFADNLRLIYWVAGPASRNCCRLLGGAYSDFSEFSRNIAFLVRGERPDLRDAFDYGLDMAQVNGTTEKIFNSYVPLSPW